MANNGPVSKSVKLLFDLDLYTQMIHYKILYSDSPQKISQEDPVSHWYISGLINNCSQRDYAVWLPMVTNESN